MEKPTDTSPLHWEAAVPFKAWLSAPALKRRSTVIFVLMVVAPAVIFWYVSGLPSSSHSARYDYNWLGWAFAAYVGVAWRGVGHGRRTGASPLIVLWVLVRPKVVAWHAALVIALALATQVPLAIFLETKLHPAGRGSPAASSGSPYSASDALRPATGATGARFRSRSSAWRSPYYSTGLTTIS